MYNFVHDVNRWQYSQQEITIIQQIMPIPTHVHTFNKNVIDVNKRLPVLPVIKTVYFRYNRN